MYPRIRSKQKEISSFLLFAFFFLSFDSRFILNLKISVFPVLIPYFFIIIILIIKYKAVFQIDIRLRKIWILQMLFILPILISFLFIEKNTDLASYLNGLIYYIIIYFPLILVLAYFSKCDQKHKNRYIKLYVYAILLIAIISIIEIAIIYIFKTHIFSEIFSHWPNLITKADESGEIFGIGIPGIVIFRSLGFSGDPSIAGFIYLIGIIIYNQQFKKNKTIIILILFMALLMTFSASAILCTIIYLLIIYGKRFSIKRIVKSIFFIFIVFAILTANNLSIIMRIIKLRFSPEGSAQSHLIINSEALKVFFNNPFGVGYRTFGNLYPEIYSAHNSYIQILVETGIVGFMFIFIWLVYMVVTIYNHKSCYSTTFLYILFFLLIMSFAHDLLLRFEFLFPLMFLATLSLSNNDNNNQYENLNTI